jgi:hypothetical protein
MGTVWSENGDLMEGNCAAAVTMWWTATTVDLVFWIEFDPASPEVYT